MKTQHKSGSVLWQLAQNIDSKKLLIQAADDDIKRANIRRAEAMEELAEYERAYAILNATAKE